MRKHIEITSSDPTPTKPDLFLRHNNLQDFRRVRPQSDPDTGENGLCPSLSEHVPLPVPADMDSHLYSVLQPYAVVKPPGTYGSTLRIFLKSSSLTAMVLPLSILSCKLRKFRKRIYNCFICYTIRHSDISGTSKRASRNDQNIVFLRGITKFFFICNW